MDGQNQRNTILAIALSLLVLLGWQFFIVGPQVERQREAEAIAEIERAGEVAPTIVTEELPGGASATGGGIDAALTPGAALGLTSRADAVAATPRVPIDTPAVTGSINLTGARLDDLILDRYRQAVDEGSPPIELLSPANLPTGYFVELGYSGQGAGPLPGPDTVWTAPEGAMLTQSTPVTLTYDNGAGLLFERTVSLDENYLFTFADWVTNSGPDAIAIRPYGRSTRFSKPTTPQVFVLHEGMIGFLGEDGLQEIDYGDVEDDGVLAYDSTAAGWLGITDKYWATSLIPDPAGGAFTPRFVYLETGRPRWQADFQREPTVLPAGGTVETVTRVYAGAKVSSIIDEVGDAYAIPKFDLMIDWGWFYFITRPMFWLIDGLYHFVGNFGVAILLATVVVKLLFFPLANKSYVSMAGMKKLQPKMQEIRDQYGDDRQGQQRALMELYKTEKINPVAGCWPVLLQIPVFFALYKVLYVTIEMRHAPFFGWIQDLSAPDPSSIWELFGLFPWGADAVLPAFLLLGVWPIIMGITMFLQMRLNPMPPDPTQQLIFTWMPVVFTFMLSTFPAGLVIYWAWNNTLTIIQQSVIMKRQGAKIELWDNIRAMFTRKSPDPAE